MEEEEREGEASNCPLLMPRVSGISGLFSAPVYCRPPSGRVRVPPPDRLMSLCSAGHPHDGPGYRRWRPVPPSD